MLTMEQARRKAYNVFPPDLDEQARTKQVNQLKYIEHLSIATKTVTDGWPVLDVFKNPETGLLYTERSKINQKFFEFREKIPAEAPKDQAISEVLASRVQEACKGFLESSLQQCFERVDELKHKVKVQSVEVLNQQRSLARASAALKGLKELQALGDKNLVNEVRRTLEEGFYELHPIQNSNKIRLLTAPIKLYFRNQLQAVEVLVPMGQYVVEIYPTDDGILQVRVYAGKENPIYMSSRDKHIFIHPHVGYDGSVCFGNLMTEVNLAAATLNVAKFSRLVRDALSHYNNDNPHIQLHKFEERWKAGEFADETVFSPDGIEAVVDEMDDGDEDPAEQDGGMLEPVSDDWSVTQEVLNSLRLGQAVHQTMDFASSAYQNMGSVYQNEGSMTSRLARESVPNSWQLMNVGSGQIFSSIHQHALEMLPSHARVWRTNERVDGQENRFVYRRRRDGQWELAERSIRNG